MPSIPDYSQAEDWASLLEIVGSVSGEGLQELTDYAQQKLEASTDPSWAIPMGFSLWKAEKFVEALEALELGNSLAPTSIEYNIIKGMTARRVPGQELLARKSYFQALKIDPFRGDVYYNIGNMLRDDDPKQAEKAYLVSLEIDNKAHLSWHNLGLALNEQDRHAEAFKAFRIGILLNPAYPDGWCNSGLALFGMEDFSRAIRYFRYTLELDEGNEAGHVNLGYALMNEMRPLEALECLKKGVEISSGSVNAIWNLSLIQLMLGNYREGWDLYEARFKTDQFKETVYPTNGLKIDDFSELPKVGEPPVVVWSEQGMGDAIQFCRYLYLLEQSSIPFVFVARKSLFTLMKNWLPYSEKVVQEKTWDPKSDSRSQIALMSLPRLFKTDLHTVPSYLPYLKAPGDPPDDFRIEKAAGGINIGIAWASNPDNKAMYKHKTMPANLLIPHLLDLVELDLIDLHSLQVGPDADQLDPLKSNSRFIDWNSRLNDFADTAYVIDQLDLVISVDTAVAHLAGALGKPIWLLLPANADFRWLLNCSDCPWYPTMRIFRQHERGDWKSVAQDVIDALKIVFALDTNALASEKLAQ